MTRSLLSSVAELGAAVGRLALAYLLRASWRARSRWTRTASLCAALMAASALTVLVPLSGPIRMTVCAVLVAVAAGLARHRVAIARERRSADASRWGDVGRWLLSVRVVRRLLAVLTVGGAVVGMVAARALTLWLLVLVAAVVAGVEVSAVVRRVGRRKHEMERLRPLHKALAPVAGVDACTDPDAWLRVPRDYRAERAVIRIMLPVGAVAGDEDDGEGVGWGRRRSELRGSLVAVVCEKLGLSRSDMTATFHMQGARPFVELRHRAPVPRKVTVQDAAEALQAAPESAPVLGMARGLRPVSADFDAESPHILCSIGTGGGKSALGKGVAAQELRAGVRVVVLDVKRTSQRWMKDHPHVRYFRDVPAIHAELTHVLAEEINRRQKVADDEENAYVGPRILVIVEERNELAKRLKTYWSQARESSDPAQSPAITALNSLEFMGREARMNIFSVAQYADALTMGGGAGRENYACRIIGRATQNIWRMLAPEVGKFPRRTTREGNFHVVLGDSPIETQGIWWSDDEAREWAWSCFPEGRESQVSHLSQQAFYLGRCPETVPPADLGRVDLIKQPAPEATQPAPEVTAAPTDAEVAERFAELVADIETTPSGAEETATPSPSAGERPATPEAVSLKEAAELGIVELSDSADKALAILRKARHRDPEFPAPVQQRGQAQLFAPDELVRWAQNRERA